MVNFIEEIVDENCVSPDLAQYSPLLQEYITHEWLTQKECDELFSVLDETFKKLSDLPDNEKKRWCVCIYDILKENDKACDLVAISDTWREFFQFDSKNDRKYWIDSVTEDYNKYWIDDNYRNEFKTCFSLLLTETQGKINEKLLKFPVSLKLDNALDQLWVINNTNNLSPKVEEKTDDLLSRFK
jgi:hypothetical protein